ncbi:speckle-type POZ protein-like isoform X1 [Planococcus citri]|uniref:speckle-type POZ protein-like isoform X1 n=1 Tax=Planococcus citri TaxID=170843 RepID=UPI0031F9BFD8
MSQSNPSVVLPTKSKTSIPDWFCITSGIWRKTSFLWTIKDFKEYHCEVNKLLKSSSFFSNTDPEYEWYLTIVEAEEYFGLFLNLDRGVNDNNNEVFVNMTMCLRDVEGNEALGRQQTRAKFTVGNDRHGYPNFVSKKALFDPDPNNKFLIEDKLTVFCELKFAKMEGNDDYLRRRPEVNVTISDNALKGLERMLHNQTFVDVTFVVDGKNFGAHKSILASRSPVFEAMFIHDMQENRSNEVNISDIRSEVFDAFLQYMYTDKTPNCKLVTELFVVADKYQVEGLQVLCEEIILKELSPGNAIDLLLFADLHRAKRLLKQVAFYIKISPINLMATQSWKNAILTRPNLFEIVNGVCDIKCPIGSSEVQLTSDVQHYVRPTKK